MSCDELHSSWEARKALSSHPFMFTFYYLGMRALIIFALPEVRHMNRIRLVFFALRVLQPLILIVKFRKLTKHERCKRVCSNDQLLGPTFVPFKFPFFTSLNQNIIEIVFPADHKSTLSRSAND